MTGSMNPSGRKVSRPAQGNNSTRLTKPAGPQYKTEIADAAPRVTKRGSVSKPSPGPGPAYKVPGALRRVKNPKTMA